MDIILCPWLLSYSLYNYKLQISGINGCYSNEYLPWASFKNVRRLYIAQLLIAINYMQFHFEVYWWKNIEFLRRLNFVGLTGSSRVYWNHNIGPSIGRPCSSNGLWTERFFRLHFVFVKSHLQSSSFSAGVSGSDDDSQSNVVP